MSKFSNKARAVRSRERPAQIDFESDGAVRLFGIDRESSRKVIKDIGKGKKVWGLQAISGDSPGLDAPAGTAGEISGWPLDPSLYEKNGQLVEESGDSNSNGASQPEGTINGMNYRGMVPGAIPIVKVEQTTEGLSPRLNYP